MSLFFRVDDRLLHGQVVCSWVPFLKIDTLIVASDDYEDEMLKTAIREVCRLEDVEIEVKGILELSAIIKRGDFNDSTVLVIVSGLKDAMRLYEEGVRFTSLNIGNVHHNDGGRKLSQSVIVDKEDEDIIEKFLESGVSVEIRDVPTRPLFFYAKRSS